MNIEELIGKLDLFLSTDGCNLDNETVQPVEGIYEEVKPESKEADKADMEQAEYNEVKAVEPEVDGDTVARKLLKQFEALETAKIEKAEYDTIDVKEPEVEKAPKLEAEAVDIVEEYTCEDDLGLYIINDGRMYNKYCLPAQKEAEAGKEVDWLKIAVEGARRYKREIENRKFDAPELKATAEYIKDYYEKDIKKEESLGESKLDEFVNTDKLFDLDDKIANVENQLVKIRQEIEKIPAGTTLTPEQEKLFKDRELANNILKGLNKRRDEVLAESMNEVSDEKVKEVGEKRLSNFLNAIDKEKETFKNYVDARNIDDQELNGAKELKDVRKYQWQNAEQEKEEAANKLRGFDRLFYKRNKRKQESVNEKLDIPSLANGMLWDACAELGYKKLEELANSYNDARELFDMLNYNADDEVIDYAQDILTDIRLNGINEEHINEISQELADKVHTRRQMNATKAVIDAKKAELAAEDGIEKEPETEDEILLGKEKINNIDVQHYRDEAANALKKQRKNQKLYTKWRKSKGIDGFEGLDESLNEEKKDKPELVVEFEDGDNKHRIVRKDEKYFIQYNINGKIRKTRTGVENLSTAVTALKKKCPKAIEIKREPEEKEEK